jgi:hypothetical protein
MFSKILVSLAAVGLVTTAAAAQTSQTTTTKTTTMPMAHSSMKMTTKTSTKTTPGKRYAYGHSRTCRTVTHHGKKTRVCSANHVAAKMTMHKKTTTTTHHS